MTYVVHPGSGIKRRCCRNDQTNDNSFLNVIDVNSTIQVRRVFWSGFTHTGSLLKQHKNEFYYVRWLNNFHDYKVFDKKIPGCMTYVVIQIIMFFCVAFVTTLTSRADAHGQDKRTTIRMYNYQTKYMETNVHTI